VYTSATDCIGNATPGFNCGPYVVEVGTTPGPPPATAGVPAPGVAASAAGPVVSNTNVTLDEKNGFSPNTLTIRAGQTVTWTNAGTTVHTVTSNPGYFNAFDSGGLDKNQKFSYNFTLPGTYGYHSQTEPTYTTDPNNNNTVSISYAYSGTIVVQ
jgi:plastocyanin